MKSQDVRMRSSQGSSIAVENKGLAVQSAGAVSMESKEYLGIIAQNKLQIGGDVTMSDFRKGMAYGQPVWAWTDKS